MTTTLTREAVRAWPKTELHCHLDGSLRLTTMLELAHAQGKIGLLPSDSREGLANELRKIDDSPTLESYLAWFDYSIPLMQSEAALQRVAYELVADAAKENLRYFEVRFSPILHTAEGLTLEQATEAALDGLQAAGRDFGMHTAAIICALRDRHQDASHRLAELAAAYQGKGVVALDLAGGEAGNPVVDHVDAFNYARRHLLHITIHAGENWGPESIRQALYYGGAQRIGHGVSLQHDPALLAYVRDNQIPLEVCPTSNVQTHVVPSYEGHPVYDYLAAGIPITVHTDSRLFSHTTVTDELWLLYENGPVTPEQLRQITLNGFRAAFAPWDLKQDLLREAEAAIPTFASTDS